MKLKMDYCLRIQKIPNTINLEKKDENYENNSFN